MSFKSCCSNPVVEHVCILPVIEFGKSDFGVGVDDRLLINVSAPFDVSYIIKCLG